LGEGGRLLALGACRRRLLSKIEDVQKNGVFLEVTGSFFGRIVGWERAGGGRLRLVKKKEQDSGAVQKHYVPFFFS
jgi:hypothetical protein